MVNPRESIKQGASDTWSDLPDAVRRGALDALDRLPGGLKAWRGLIDQAMEHVQFAAGGKRSVAIIGPANSGKSTLYNLMIRRGEAKSEVSAVPGTTRQTLSGDAGIFHLIDTPGADAIGAVGRDERDKAIAAAQTADLIVLLLDGTHGVRGPERELHQTVVGTGRPVITALNKVDLIPGSEVPKVLQQAASALGVEERTLVAVSAKTGSGVERLLSAMVKNEPGIVAALGEALPLYRWHLAQTVIGRSASAAAAIAVTPLPIVDFVPLLGVQAAMVLSIARIYTYKITLARARELVVTFGAAVLGRTLFYELSKLGGPPGWLVAAGVSVGTTAAIGYASAVWFERGARLPTEAIRRIAQVTAQSMIDRLKDLGRRRPKRATLHERVTEALQDLPMPEDEIPGPPPGDAPA